MKSRTIPFTLIEIGGGHHPIIDIELDGKLSKALIDTGSNCTISTSHRREPMVFKVSERHYRYKQTDCFYRYPEPDIAVLIGNDLLIREKAVIDYSNNTITFNG